VANSLRIFISHKMPTDTAMAEEIGSKLALFGGNQVTVTHAGKFRYGDKWRERIEEELTNADWLIFLATGQNEDWGFCLFECGYFSNTVAAAGRNPKLLKTLCRKGDKVNAALQAFNALEISVSAVKKLLREIYVEPPYAFNAGLKDDQLIQTAEEIVKVFEGGERVERNFDVAPSVVIELVVSQETRDQLSSGRIPPDCPVTGLKDWQRLFGKAIDTGAWLWGDLRKDWPFVEAYEFLIAKMILDALDGEEPTGAIFRAPKSDELFRMTLRRFEKMSSNSHRFHFTAGLVDLPFDLLQPGSTVDETVLYHLVNLTWYFRRRVVDKLYGRVLDVKTMRNPPEATISQLYDELGRELMLVTAQSIMRKVDNLRVVQKALGVENPEISELADQAGTYGELQQRIFDAMADGAGGLNRIADDLYKLALQNHEFYNVAASRYSELARNLPKPDAPDA
jgi:hypothetical protein